MTSCTRIVWILPGIVAAAVQAGAGLSIINSNSALYLAWHGESNVAYQVEHAVGLDDGAWSNGAPGAVGSGGMIQQPVSESVGGPEPDQAFFRLAKTYPSATEAAFGDMLTPVYYNAATNAAFRAEVDRFIYYARQEVFHHPLEDASGHIPAYSIPDMGRFGATKPPWGTPQSYHPASDLHVGNAETDVQLFAAHDGVVAVYRDADKYRHYLTITKDVVDAAGTVEGKVSTLYAHIDLDLDEAEGLVMDGRTVAKGDLVSQNLYSGTVGGPHLHFEIRYYRASDSGSEEFYGGPLYSEPSSGPWQYGYWEPQVGYGFAHPGNHGLDF